MWILNVNVNVWTAPWTGWTIIWTVLGLHVGPYRDYTWDLWDYQGDCFGTICGILLGLCVGLSWDLFWDGLHVGLKWDCGMDGWTIVPPPIRYTPQSVHNQRPIWVSFIFWDYMWDPVGTIDGTVLGLHVGLNLKILDYFCVCEYSRANITLLSFNINAIFRGYS